MSSDLHSIFPPNGKAPEAIRFGGLAVFYFFRSTMAMKFKYLRPPWPCGRRWRIRCPAAASRPRTPHGSPSPGPEAPPLPDTAPAAPPAGGIVQIVHLFRHPRQQLRPQPIVLYPSCFSPLALAARSFRRVYTTLHTTSTVLIPRKIQNTGELKSSEFPAMTRQTIPARYVR